MVYGIVHNLRTPLNVALNRTQFENLEIEKKLVPLLKADARLNAGIKFIQENNKKIQAAVLKTSEIVDSLLCQAKLDASGGKQYTNLNELIIKEVSFLRIETLARHQTDIRLNLAPDLPDIFIRQMDFIYIFHNIIGNACDAMVSSKIKHLDISTDFSPEQIIIKFADTGTGISEEVRDQIFNPFYSTKNNPSETGCRSGLGLFVSTRLLAVYNGKITAENRKPYGTVITINIS
jgi:two-component system, NtrC family, sensor kinase